VRCTCGCLSHGMRVFVCVCVLMRGHGDVFEEVGRQSYLLVSHGHCYAFRIIR